MLYDYFIMLSVQLIIDELKKKKSCSRRAFTSIPSLFHLSPATQWRCFCKQPFLTSQGRTFFSLSLSLSAAWLCFEFFFLSRFRRVDVSGRKLNERGKTNALAYCLLRYSRGVPWVESWLVSRGSSEGAACCNGLLQIDGEIRRHTIRPR